MTTPPLDQPAAGDPRYDGFRIASVWAFTVVDPADDQEGLITLASPSGPMPMIASDRVRLDRMRPVAAIVARQLGRPVTLRKFVPSDPDPLETINP